MDIMRSVMSTMLKTLQLITLFVVLVVLYACKPARPEAATDLTLTIKEGSISSLTQRVIAGASITITINNTTHETVKVMLLTTHIVVNADVTSNLIIYLAQVPAGQGISDSFTAPKAAGEYPIVYSQAGNQEIGGILKIVFVQPEYAR